MCDERGVNTQRIRPGSGARNIYSPNLPRQVEGIIRLGEASYVWNEGFRAFSGSAGLMWLCSLVGCQCTGA